MRSTLLALGCALGARGEFLLTFDDFEEGLGAESDLVSVTGLVIIQRTTTIVEAPAGLLDVLFGVGAGAPALTISQYDDDGAYYDDALYDDADDARHDFECPCGADVDALCDTEVAGDDYYASVFEKRLCLARNRGDLSEGCGAHLAANPTVVEYCARDVLATRSILERAKHLSHHMVRSLLGHV